GGGGAVGGPALDLVGATLLGSVHRHRAAARHAGRLTGPFTKSGQITCQNRPDRSLVNDSGGERTSDNKLTEVMVEGKGFVFVSPLTSRHLSTPTLQITADRGKTRARTRHALCGGWDVELARRAPPPLSLNRF